MFKFYNKHKKLISVLLCVMIVFTVFAGSYIQADAFVIPLAVAGKAIVLALITAFGITNSQELSAIATDIYNNLSPAAQSDLTAAGQAIISLKAVAGLNGLFMGQTQVKNSTLQEIIEFWQEKFSVRASTGTTGLVATKYDVSSLLTIPDFKGALASTLFATSILPKEAGHYTALANALADPRAGSAFVVRCFNELDEFSFNTYAPGTELSLCTYDNLYVELWGG